jgi:hypothetical protein
VGGKGRGEKAELAGYGKLAGEREEIMRRAKVLAFLGVVVMAAVPLWAGGACCAKDQAVSRQVENIPGGVKITLTANDAQVVAKLQSQPEACKGECKDCPMHAQGVTRKVEKIDKGVVITATASDPKLVEALQAHAASMGTMAKGSCCSKGAKGSCCNKGEKASGCTREGKQRT